MRFQSFNNRPESVSLIHKVIAVLAYLVLGFTVTSTSLSALISIYFVLFILYTLIIQRQKYSIPHFVRYHLLQALLLNLVLAVLIWFLLSLLQFLMTIPGLNIIAGYIGAFVFNVVLIPLSFGYFTPTFINIVVLSLAVAMSGYACMGQYTQLPYISDAVRRID